ncbi:MAG: trypsin-like peptidase domain-containing protein [Pirellulales bacterium]
MKKIIALCLVSALGGAVLAETWRTTLGPRPVAAQEPLESRPPSARKSPADSSPAPGRSATRLPNPRIAPADESLTPEELVNISVYEKVNRSVVNIRTETLRNGAFFFLEVEVPGEGAGSGSVLDTRGHILTNYHVIENARLIEVALFDGKNYDARIVGKDESTDIAVLKINAPAESLFPVELGDSTRLRVGQRVYAIGNPFGFERTLSTGIISSLNRTLPSRNHRLIKSIIQIDAAINPGNSGGPLLDSHGRLIGMNTAIASPTGQSAGVGFAIPVANITRVVPPLIETGRVVRPDAGITHVYPTERGLLIAAMTPGGPAEKAGLRGFQIAKQRRRQGPFTYETRSVDRSAADLIVAVDGELIASPQEFLSLIESKEAGDEVTITVVRGGREVNVPVRLSADDS